MARIQGTYIQDEDTGAFVRGSGRTRRRAADEGEEWALDQEPDAPREFLRGQKRVPVRRGKVPRRWGRWLTRLFWLLLVLAALAAAAYGVRQYALRAARFRIASGDDIVFAGTEHVSRHQVMQDVLGEDIGKNIFSVPIEEQRRKIQEKNPWVQSVEVMRLLPNHLRVVVKERTPVAFVALGSHIGLIDANGVVMEYSATSRTPYSFPVIDGMGEGDTPVASAERMKVFGQLMADLDANGAHYSGDISEVHLANLSDVQVTVAAPGGAVLLHLGADRFRARYEIFLANVEKWRQSVPKLHAVDLSSDSHVTVNPGAGPAPAAAPAAVAPPTAAESTPAAQASAPATEEPKPKPKPVTHHRRRHKPAAAAQTRAAPATAAPATTAPAPAPTK